MHPAFKTTHVFFQPLPFGAAEFITITVLCAEMEIKPCTVSYTTEKLGLVQKIDLFAFRQSY